jgi:hypothetical protein
VKVNAHYVETPDFCVQGFAENGTATYTATAPGFGTIKGNVKLAKSAIVMIGPLKQPSFNSTPGEVSKITLFSVYVDAADNVVQQAVAGGMSAKVDITSSDEKVGATVSPTVTINPGESSAATQFKPAGVGTTTLAMKVPHGFITSPKMATITAVIDLPGLGLLGDINLGKDLQVSGDVLLGQAAPEGGLTVTLTSEDPKKLVLSTKAEELGSKTITLHVPAGQVRAHYFVQALSESGTINYTATAPGYRKRVAPVYLAPSGIMVVYKPYGPPDRAEVQRDTRDIRPFTTSLSNTKPVQLSLWVVYLDRDTHRGADITVQSLRAGATATVELKSSNPDVAKVPSTITIPSLRQEIDVDFTPLSEGHTVISVNAPAGFTAPTNAVTVAATITK